jgi:hypothetical protein
MASSAPDPKTYPIKSIQINRLSIGWEIVTTDVRGNAYAYPTIDPVIMVAEAAREASKFALDREVG